MKVFFRFNWGNCFSAHAIHLRQLQEGCVLIFKKKILMAKELLMVGLKKKKAVHGPPSCKRIVGMVYGFGLNLFLNPARPTSPVPKSMAADGSATEDARAFT